MPWKETVAGGVVGGLAGAATAWVTARGKVNAVRAEFEGKFEEIRLRRAHEVEDRTAETRAGAEAAAAERTRALLAAATNLASALRKPDAMKHNLHMARKEVNAATAAIQAKGEVADLAQQLIRASENEGIDAADSVIRRLRELA